MVRFVGTSCVLFLLFISGLYSQNPLIELEKKHNPGFFEIRSSYEKYWNSLPQDERKGWKQYKRWEHFWENRVGNDGKFPNARKIMNEYDLFKRKESNRTQSLVASWRLLGPIGTPPKSTSGRTQGIGRINVVRIHPSNANIIWIGSALGGLWKTTNGGKAWSEIPYTQFLSLGISDIAISVSNQNLIYVATGDDDGSYGADGFYSIGIIKSTDGGVTWEQTGFMKNLEDNFIVSRLIVHPTKPNTVIASTSGGIYKSTDGGATWQEKLKDGAYYRDMEMNTSNPSTIYASTFTWAGNSAIYRSLDEGETWTKLKELSKCVRIELAVSRDDPKYVYALASNSDTRGFHSFLVSTDQGNTWITKYEIGTGANLLGWYDGTGNDKQGQGQYDLALAVSDLNKNEIYVGGVNIWKSTDGGSTWKKTAHWQNSSKYAFVHADHHELVFTKNTSIIYSGHDGGIDKSTDGGKTWTNLNANLSIMQFYRMGASEIDTSLIIGGSQDNGTSMLSGKEWTGVYAADGFEAAFDPKDTTRCYCSIYYGSIYRSTNHGRNFNKEIINTGFTKETAPWLTPYVVSQSNPNHIYVGMQNIWFSSNYGDAFAKISDFQDMSQIKAIAVSLTNKNVIYAATKSKLYKTTNLGADWVSLDPAADNISYIAIDPANDKRIWISMSNFNNSNKVLTFDGEKWTNLTGNLPNIPVNCIAYQANSPDRLYIGTDIGVYYSDYNSGTWESFSEGLPKVVVNELEINYKSGKIRAATYGRGIWESPIIIANVKEPEITIIGNSTFCFGDSAILQAEEGYSSYLWSTGERTKSIVVKEPGLYSVTVQNEQGTARSKGIEINVKPVNKMNISILGVNPMCNLDTLKLKAGFGFTDYEWSTSETTKEIIINTPGKYYVIGTMSNGCKSCSDTVEIFVDPPPDKPVITREMNTLVSTESQFYQWLFEGDSIPGANNRKLDIIENGSYSVIVTVGQTCYEQSDPFIVLKVDELTNDGFVSVNPNPAGNFIELKVFSNNSGILGYRIMDINGRVIIQENDIKNDLFYTKKIDLSGLSQGIYFCLVTLSEKNYYFKLIRN